MDDFLLNDFGNRESDIDKSVQAIVTHEIIKSSLSKSKEVEEVEEVEEEKLTEREALLLKIKENIIRMRKTKSE